MERKNCHSCQRFIALHHPPTTDELGNTYHLTFQLKTNKKCDDCTKFFSQQNYVRINKQNICNSCLQRNYKLCCKCNEAIHIIEIFTSATTNLPYCRNCYHELFAECDSCANEFPYDDLETCRTCRGTYCQECGCSCEGS